ncbi:hypothetical protein BJ138DRAFT_209820 [Hygrophoropsis aurantiaca]|uniref:Uncharacterized protein n=1 Tax=Hygrophoropsis aurantiaca TaxID=72124 RepID=A0ACB8A8L5_9AGAM|nr:hypothetical protein BJ138DRAFT_209820 [Hygrophoropsis aurantiaca]
MTAAVDNSERKALNIAELQRFEGLNEKIHFNATMAPALRRATQLHSDQFAKVWWRCVLSHKQSWDNGVRHADISLINLMFYMNKKDDPVGVLVDHDLAENDQCKEGGQRVGSPSYMAIELLFTPRPKRLYRHGLESFFWVLVFFSLQYKNGRQRIFIDRPLDHDWVKSTVERSREKKNDFFNHIATFTPVVASSNRKLWNIVFDYSLKLDFQRISRKIWVHYQAEEPAEVPDDVFKVMEEIVLKELPMINY